jgi:hypothetical protein
MPEAELSFDVNAAKVPEHLVGSFAPAPSFCKLAERRALFCDRDAPPGSLETRR